MFRVSSRVWAALAVALLLCPAVANGTTILLDNYSSNDSSNYTAYNDYNSAGTFAVGTDSGATVVTASALLPSIPLNSETMWYWTGPNGEKLHPGDSVSLDCALSQNVNVTLNVTALAFGTTTSAQTFSFGLYENATLSTGTYPGHWAARYAGVNYPFVTNNLQNFQQFTRLTVTRGTGANENVFTLVASNNAAANSGYGTTGTYSYTASGLLSSQALYFGPLFYRTATSTAAPVPGAAENLTYTPAPEPGTVVLLTTGLLGLLAYAWRKRK